MKRIRIGIIGLTTALACSLVPHVAWAVIENVQVTNLTSSSATVIWTTDQPADGCVRYGITPSLGLETCDPRPDDDVHYVTITSLMDETVFYFEVQSGAEIDDNGGALYTFETSRIGAGLPYVLYGKVLEEGGSIPAQEALTVVQLTHDGSISVPLCSLTDENGYWTVNLGNLKIPTSGDVMPYTTGDVLSIIAIAGVDGTGSSESAVDGSSPQDAGAVTLATGSEPQFIRSDVDDSGVVDISDPIYNLVYQFAGGPAPPCLDCADDDDSGEVDISDPIYSLQFQFAGGLPPPAPYPSCGVDPTEDALTCATYTHCGGIQAPILVLTSGDGDRVWLSKPAEGTSAHQRFKLFAATTEPLFGFEVEIDPGSAVWDLISLEPDANLSFDFISATSTGMGSIRLGAIPDFGLSSPLPAGSHCIATIVLGSSSEKLDPRVIGARMVRTDLEAVEPRAGQPAGLEPVPLFTSQSITIGAPNPYRAGDAISLSANVDMGAVRILVYDLSGRIVRSMISGAQGKQAIEIAWDGRTESGLPAAGGVYFLDAQSGGLRGQLKLVLVH